MNDKKTKELDEFHYHEFMDRTDCVIEIIEKMLQEHRVPERCPELNQHVENAIDELTSAGNISFEKFEKRRNKNEGDLSCRP